MIIVKLMLSFALGIICGVVLFGLTVVSAPEPHPPQDLEPEIRMISVSKIPGAAEVKTVTFCIEGKKMAAIYTTSELHPIGTCEVNRQQKLPTPMPIIPPEKERTTNERKRRN